jgi:transposase
MYHIRTTKTASGATAVQVVRYERRKMIIAVHIGSGRSDAEIAALKKEAAFWIEKRSKQHSFFPEKKGANLLLLDKCRYLGVRYGFIYEVIMHVLDRFGFRCLTDKKMLSDLALIRIVEPASKLRSFELLEEMFAIRYRRQDFYRYLPEFSRLKEQIEDKVAALAKNEFDFDFSLVFYDVTTLYFESFKPDELRKPGFSKDNKPQQPQVLIGLIVDSQGFPVAYEIFPGNKFEGHTLIPVISAFKKKHAINKLTVVADAAMISLDNVKALRGRKLEYIVGARLGNLPEKTIKEIDLELERKDGKSLRLKTGYGTLICSFSSKRYRKDKSEMEKQIEKAKILLSDPSKTKRIKFIKGKEKARLELNEELIEKTEKLLGIKGYYTNLEEKDADDQTIIERYHDLWRVELAFRIAKSDLEIRPIFHFKEHTVPVHILICFMALAVSKYMEIKTGESIRQIVKTLKSVTDARVLNTLTGKEISMRSEIADDIKDMLSKLGVSY